MSFRGGIIVVVGCYHWILGRFLASDFLDSDRIGVVVARSSWLFSSTWLHQEGLEVEAVALVRYVKAISVSCEGDRISAVLRPPDLVSRSSSRRFSGVSRVWSRMSRAVSPR